jgi:PDZ domain-containing protein
MPRRLAPVSRRLVTLIIAGVCVLAGLIIAVVMPVPYVALSPGPTLNTLGSPEGQPLVQISGVRTYPTSGHLNMVTVSYSGGPGTSFNIFNALGAWLTPHDAVVPQSEIFNPYETPQQVVQQDTQQMVGSQQDATAAALCFLHIKFQTLDMVQATVRNTPAYGQLEPGDVITAVDGTPADCQHSVVTMIRDRKPGTPVTLTIERKGVARTIRLTTKNVNGQPVIGVELATPGYVFPFTVKIYIPQIGGPSAGMMFALALIDKLTPDNLTGGRFIAGTGEISPTGAVQPIGGIQQKLAGARGAGATIFLTPAANCADTVGAVPHGLRIVKVSTLADAVHALEAIKAGRPVPSC